MRESSGVGGVVGVRGWLSESDEKRAVKRVPGERSCKRSGSEATEVLSLFWLVTS